MASRVSFHDWIEAVCQHLFPGEDRSSERARACLRHTLILDELRRKRGATLGEAFEVSVEKDES